MLHEGYNVASRDPKAMAPTSVKVLLRSSIDDHVRSSKTTVNHHDGHMSAGAYCHHRQRLSISGELRYSIEALGASSIPTRPSEARASRPFRCIRILSS